MNIALYFSAMRTFRLNILMSVLLAALFAVGFKSVCAAQEEAVSSESELALLDLINQARANPLAMAQALGRDPEQVLKELPGLKDILTQGLPSLAMESRLYEAAAGHTADMIARGYYSHDTLPLPGSEQPPPGSPWRPGETAVTYQDRIAAAGYAAVADGESLGFLWFTNYIDPVTAAGLIFQNMFLDELNPSTTEKRNILDPELREAGIGIGAGSFTVSGYKINAYLCTCDFGSREEHLIESELLTLINQARANPLAVAAGMGMDPDQILRDLPELAPILTAGLPPVLFHRSLYASASDHATDMLDKWYFSYFSPDGRGPWDRIAETGYGPVLTGESIGLTASLCPADLSEVAARLFEAAFRDELSPDWLFQRNILNPDLKEAGAAFAGFSFCYMEDFPYRYDLWVADFGTRQEGPGTTLTGVVFADADENGLYSMGEGLAGVAVALTNEDGVRIDLLTDGSGRFTAAVEPGKYQVEVTWGEQVFVQAADVAEGEVAGVWVEISGGV